MLTTGISPATLNAKKRTPKEKAQKLVENGIEVFILRWKKKSTFPVKMSCFEEVKLVERFDSELMANVYDKVPVRGEMTEFIIEDVDEGVPIAYIPSTDKNKKIIASMLKNSPFVVSALVTFSGVKSSSEAVASIKEYMKTAPKSPEVKWRGRDINGGLLVSPDSQKANSKDNPPKLDSAKKCFKEAENFVHDKYKILLKPMQDRLGKGWKRTKEYTDTIGLEVLSVYKSYLDSNGIVDSSDFIDKNDLDNDSDNDFGDSSDKN